ncbi:double-strand break repair protein [Acrasis kona]|uniref:Double-strand break repair protein n=1 Tax=Acrasis kona TaxID=1008807 RepID=A0AAW2ZHF7_9EUKA
MDGGEQSFFYEYREETMEELEAIGLERERQQIQNPFLHIVQPPPQPPTLMIPQYSHPIHTTTPQANNNQYIFKDDTIIAQNTTNTTEYRQKCNITNAIHKEDWSKSPNRSEKRLVFNCYGNKKSKKNRPEDAFEMTFSLQ